MHTSPTCLPNLGENDRGRSRLGCVVTCCVALKVKFLGIRGWGVLNISLVKQQKQTFQLIYLYDKFSTNFFHSESFYLYISISVRRYSHIVRMNALSQMCVCAYVSTNLPLSLLSGAPLWSSNRRSLSRCSKILRGVPDTTTYL